MATSGSRPSDATGRDAASTGEAAKLLAEIRSEAAWTARLTGRNQFSPRVMAAMARVPREVFVPTELRAAAYANGPLPIGHGQTISQPFIVALMTDLIRPRADHRILEIGTGSGYQAAVLSLLCDTVYTIERVASLGTAAAARLRDLGYHNIVVQTANGCLGWPEHAPYDGMLVTAATNTIPEALLAQLGPRGRLVIPIGEQNSHQVLTLVEKDAQGQTRRREILDVAFVPLVDHPVVKT